jgi:hypothetical protein
MKKQFKTKNKSQVKRKMKKLIFIVILGGAGYFGYIKYQKKILPFIKSNKQSLSSSWNKSGKSKKPQLKIDKKFLWKYVKKKSNRSLAMVTSRNKFNGNDIALGFRCAKAEEKSTVPFRKVFSRG